jgi:hypothetical protein
MVAIATSLVQQQNKHALVVRSLIDLDVYLDGCGTEAVLSSYAATSILR